MVKANWTPTNRTQIVSAYTATRQDGAHRYDQELGGDGNLISELNDLTLDLFYTRLERSGLGWFDHGSFTYSINSQREERVNQGGQGSNTGAIGHEPERTTSNAVQAALNKTLSSRSNLQVGGDMQFETLTSDSFNINPVNGARSLRRPRVPSGATFTQGGVFVQTGFDAVADRVRLVGAVRVGSVSYEASAADAPISGTRPLWPDDSYSTTSATFRAGAILTPAEPWTFVVSASRGFRAPHMTDLGTLGLTGSGFEVAAPDVAGRNAFVGTTADASAVSTGDAVEQLVAESSMNIDGGVRFRSRRASVDFTLPVMAISFAPIRRMASSSRTSSSVSPLCDSAITTSSSRIAPRSPWMASAGWRNQADVPVLVNVAAILRQMIPDLPMPVRITRPLQSNSTWTARSNSPSTRSTRLRIAFASVRRTFLASSSAASVFVPIQRLLASAGSAATMAWMRTRRVSSGSSRSSCNAFCASLFA